MGFEIEVSVDEYDDSMEVSDSPSAFSRKRELRLPPLVSPENTTPFSSAELAAGRQSLSKNYPLHREENVSGGFPSV